ncbi:hypothetical protein [Hymenobacter lucidus]|uniref:DUF5117 domain-containing protein n=1 Tax=Hymenobacter lucidus TaxID=2880930 RepID=A0ABS8AQY1_9BACT|nr:hypothetical protein [Hymenobacter lucidus]MCB2408630.1 hypothetical protein [Hymenobacter lucidus]
MKKSLYLLGCLCFLAACHQSATVKQTPADPAAAQSAPVHEASVKTAKVAEATPVPTPEMQTFLAQYDLAELWRPADEASLSAMNGFLGADHYRMEIVLLSVRKDTLHPGVYHVMGKDRFKKQITPFTGTITLHTINDLAIDPAEMRGYLDDEKSNAQGYTATGTYVFNEEPSRKGAGTFSGKTAVTFSLDPNRPDGLALFGLTIPATEESATRGSISLFEGTWRSYQTNEQKPTIWAYNFLPIASQVLQNFSIGEREVSINPKYARLGWNEYWTNEEWWAESGAATARNSQPTLLNPPSLKDGVATPDPVSQ